jgi:hypothetical protein
MNQHGEKNSGSAHLARKRGPRRQGTPRTSLRERTLRQNRALPCSQNARQRPKNARQSLCRAALHGKECTATTRPAKPPLPCVERKSHGKGFAERRCFAVCCAFLCRAHSFAVRLQALPCASPRSRTAKTRLCRALPLNPTRQRFYKWAAGRRSAQLGTLCRVHVHGKESLCRAAFSLPCACARQRC